MSYKTVLTENQTQILHSLAKEFPYYSKKCLKIVTKEGEICPFELNRAQMYLHSRIEAQRASLGRVRVVILKGRQQGCLDPNTKILTANLQWVKIKDLKVGQKLVACDENTLPNSNGKARCRKMKTTIVEKIWETQKEAYKITFEDGRQVICSQDHKWLSRKTKKDPQWRSLVGNMKDKRDALQVGDLVRGVTNTWGKSNFEDMWFGGMIDGEGSFDYKSRTGADLSISQIDGKVLDRMLKHVDTRKYGGCVISDDGPRRSKYGLRPVRAISIGSAASLFRLFGLSRPTRFIGLNWWEGKKLPLNQWQKIKNIEPLGVQKLIDIQTSDKTYVAEGLVSHNCTTYIQGRFKGCLEFY